MIQTKVGKRYAQSLIDLVIEKGELEAVNQDMELVLSTFNENRDLRLLLSSPVVKSDKKLVILNRIFGDKVSEVSKIFINLITRKGRESKLGDIAFAFNNLYLEHKNIVKAQIKSVDGVSDSIKNSLTELIKSTYNKEQVIIEEIKDANLIGGFVLTVNDQQVDASIQTKLEKLKQGFDYNPYVSEL